MKSKRHNKGNHDVKAISFLFRAHYVINSLRWIHDFMLMSELSYEHAVSYLRIISTQNRSLHFIRFVSISLHFRSAASSTFEQTLFFFSQQYLLYWLIFQKNVKRDWPWRLAPQNLPGKFSLINTFECLMVELKRKKLLLFRCFIFCGDRRKTKNTRHYFTSARDKLKKKTSMSETRLQSSSYKRNKHSANYFLHSALRCCLYFSERSIQRRKK